MTTRQYSSRSQQSTLTGAITAGATSITVVSGTTLLGGVSIPSGTTFTLVIDPDTAIEEIVDATAVSTNTFTIVRSVDTVGGAQAHSAGAVVRHMAIGRDFRDANRHAEADASYNDGSGNAHTMHGIAAGEGVVVGTLKTQTLTNKTLTSPTISNPTFTGTPNAEASIVFEGTTADAHETTLTVVDPTQDNTITLPNTSGTVVIADATQTLSNKTMGNALNAGGFRITNIASPVDANDAVNKTFADAQVAAAATSAASAATSATSAATSASSASTSASSALTSANSASTSAASALTSANSAATSASTMAASVAAAQTSATSAAASATAAATSASSAATSASSALTSANNASASATAAATSATSAAASATAAATSATSSATSASAAATSATSASASATAAATSATSAAASATAAATSAASAATSANSAAASYDQFDDRYLGDKTSDPTVDNDGNPLLTGALYFNTTIGAMKVYDGTNWDLVAPDTSNFIDKAILTAKGSLISASTGSTPVALTVASTNGYILTVDSATTSGLAWAAPAATGVTSVTAGDGISVTGTTASPTVAVDSTVIRTTGGQVISANTTATGLEVRQIGTGNAFVVEDSANPDASPFIIDGAGNVGIGSVTPGTPLRVYNATTSRISLDGDSTTEAVISRYSTDTGSAVLSIRKFRGSNASPSTVVTGDTLGTIRVSARGSSSTPVVAAIDYTAEGTVTGNTIPTRITILTADSGGSVTERIRFDSAGRVIIPAGGVLDAPLVTNAQVASYTLVEADAGKLVEINNAGATTLTVPTNASVPYPTGTQINILQTGAGQITVGGAGVTINGTPGLKLRAQWSSATLIKRATNTWVLVGDLSA